MIATHNIKVNGRWIMAGERYGEEPEKKPAAKPVEVKAEPVQEVAKAEEPVAEEPKAEPVKEEPKAKNASRRRKVSAE